MRKSGLLKSLVVVLLSGVLIVNLATFVFADDNSSLDWGDIGSNENTNWEEISSGENTTPGNNALN